MTKDSKHGVTKKHPERQERHSGSGFQGKERRGGYGGPDWNCSKFTVTSSTTTLESIISSTGSVSIEGTTSITSSASVSGSSVTYSGGIATILEDLVATSGSITLKPLQSVTTSSANLGGESIDIQTSANTDLTGDIDVGIGSFQLISAGTTTLNGDLLSKAPVVIQSQGEVSITGNVDTSYSSYKSFSITSTSGDISFIKNSATDAINTANFTLLANNGNISLSPELTTVGDVNIRAISGNISLNNVSSSDGTNCTIDADNSLSISQNIDMVDFETILKARSLSLSVTSVNVKSLICNGYTGVTISGATAASIDDISITSTSGVVSITNAILRNTLGSISVTGTDITIPSGITAEEGAVTLASSSGDINIGTNIFGTTLNVTSSNGISLPAISTTQRGTTISSTSTAAICSLSDGITVYEDATCTPGNCDIGIECVGGVELAGNINTNHLGSVTLKAGSGDVILSGSAGISSTGLSVIARDDITIAGSNLITLEESDGGSGGTLTLRSNDNGTITIESTMSVENNITVSGGDIELKADLISSTSSVAISSWKFTSTTGSDVEGYGVSITGSGGGVANDFVFGGSVTSSGTSPLNISSKDSIVATGSISCDSCVASVTGNSISVAAIAVNDLQLTSSTSTALDGAVTTNVDATISTTTLEIGTNGSVRSDGITKMTATDTVSIAGDVIGATVTILTNASKDLIVSAAKIQSTADDLTLRGALDVSGNSVLMSDNFSIVVSGLQTVISDSASVTCSNGDLELTTTGVVTLESTTSAKQLVTTAGGDVTLGNTMTFPTSLSVSGNTITLNGTASIAAGECVLTSNIDAGTTLESNASLMCSDMLTISNNHDLTINANAILSSDSQCDLDVADSVISGSILCDTGLFLTALDSIVLNSGGYLYSDANVTLSAISMDPIGGIIEALTSEVDLSGSTGTTIVGTTFTGPSDGATISFDCANDVLWDSILDHSNASVSITGNSITINDGTSDGYFNVHDLQLTSSSGTYINPTYSDQTKTVLKTTGGSLQLISNSLVDINAPIVHGANMIIDCSDLNISDVIQGNALTCEVNSSFVIESTGAIESDSLSYTGVDSTVEVYGVISLASSVSLVAKEIYVNDVSGGDGYIMGRGVELVAPIITLYDRDTEGAYVVRSIDSSNQIRLVASSKLTINGDVYSDGDVMLDFGELESSGGSVEGDTVTYKGDFDMVLDSSVDADESLSIATTGSITVNTDFHAEKNLTLEGSNVYINGDLESDESITITADTLTLAEGKSIKAVMNVTINVDQSGDLCLTGSIEANDTFSLNAPNANVFIQNEITVSDNDDDDLSNAATIVASSIYVNDRTIKYLDGDNQYGYVSAPRINFTASDSGVISEHDLTGTEVLDASKSVTLTYGDLTIEAPISASSFTSTSQKLHIAEDSPLFAQDVSITVSGTENTNVSSSITASIGSFVFVGNHTQLNLLTYSSTSNGSITAASSVSITAASFVQNSGSTTSSRGNVMLSGSSISITTLSGGISFYPFEQVDDPSEMNCLKTVTSGIDISGSSSVYIESAGFESATTLSLVTPSLNIVQDTDTGISAYGNINFSVSGSSITLGTDIIARGSTFLIDSPAAAITTHGNLSNTSGSLTIVCSSFDFHLDASEPSKSISTHGDFTIEATGDITFLETVNDDAELVMINCGAAVTFDADSVVVEGEIYSAEIVTVNANSLLKFLNDVTTEQSVSIDVASFSMEGSTLKATDNSVISANIAVTMVSSSLRFTGDLELVSGAFTMDSGSSLSCSELVIETQGLSTLNGTVNVAENAVLTTSATFGLAFEVMKQLTVDGDVQTISGTLTVGGAAEFSCQRFIVDGVAGILDVTGDLVVTSNSVTMSNDCSVNALHVKYDVEAAVDIEGIFDDNNKTITTIEINSVTLTINKAMNLEYTDIIIDSTNVIIYEPITVKNFTTTTVGDFDIDLESGNGLPETVAISAEDITFNVTTRKVNINNSMVASANLEMYSNTLSVANDVSITASGSLTFYTGVECAINGFISSDSELIIQQYDSGSPTSISLSKDASLRCPSCNLTIDVSALNAYGTIETSAILDITTSLQCNIFTGCDMSGVSSQIKISGEDSLGNVGGFISVQAPINNSQLSSIYITKSSNVRFTSIIEATTITIDDSATFQSDTYLHSDELVVSVSGNATISGDFQSSSGISIDCATLNMGSSLTNIETGILTIEADTCIIDNPIVAGTSCTMDIQGQGIVSGTISSTGDLSVQASQFESLSINGSSKITLVTSNALTVYGYIMGNGDVKILGDSSDMSYVSSGTFTINGEVSSASGSLSIVGLSLTVNSPCSVVKSDSSTVSMLLGSSITMCGDVTGANITLEAATISMDSSNVVDGTVISSTGTLSLKADNSAINHDIFCTGDFTLSGGVMYFNGSVESRGSISTHNGLELEQITFYDTLFAQNNLIMDITKNMTLKKKTWCGGGGQMIINDGMTSADHSLVVVIQGPLRNFASQITCKSFSLNTATTYGAFMDILSLDINSTSNNIDIYPYDHALCLSNGGTEEDECASSSTADLTMKVTGNVQLVSDTASISFHGGAKLKNSNTNSVTMRADSAGIVIDGEFDVGSIVMSYKNFTLETGRTLLTNTSQSYSSSATTGLSQLYGNLTSEGDSITLDIDGNLFVGGKLESEANNPNGIFLTAEYIELNPDTSHNTAQLIGPAIYFTATDVITNEFANDSSGNEMIQALISFGMTLTGDLTMNESGSVVVGTGDVTWSVVGDVLLKNDISIGVYTAAATISDFYNIQLTANSNIYSERAIELVSSCDSTSSFKGSLEAASITITAYDMILYVNGALSLTENGAVSEIDVRHLVVNENGSNGFIRAHEVILGDGSSIMDVTINAADSSTNSGNVIESYGGGLAIDCGTNGELNIGSESGYAALISVETFIDVSCNDIYIKDTADVTTYQDEISLLAVGEIILNGDVHSDDNLTAQAGSDLEISGVFETNEVVTIIGNPVVLSLDVQACQIIIESASTLNIVNNISILEDNSVCTGLTDSVSITAGKLVAKTGTITGGSVTITGDPNYVGQHTAEIGTTITADSRNILI
ncbi:hypothetical protein ADUPG1_013332, partial [Aduncisulcus paluster]